MKFSMLPPVVSGSDVYRGVWGKRSAIVINLCQFLIIVPFGIVTINLGLPGIMHMIDETPSGVAIFDFPMALAPALVVPIFVVVNLLVAIRLLTKQKETHIGINTTR